MSSLTISAAALHEVLTRAHIAIAEHRIDQAGTMLGTLRVLLDPAPCATPIPLPAGPGKVPPHPDTPAADGAAAIPPPAPTPLPAQAAAGRSSPRRKRMGRPGTIWTADREALLRADYPACTDRPALLARLNALPGEPIHSVKAVQVKAGALGVRADLRALRAIAQQAGAAGGRASVEARPTVPPTMRTPERLAALPALWADATLPVRAIMDRLNTLPGDRIVNTQTLYKWAGMIGLDTVRPMPAPVAPLAPAPEPEPPRTPAPPEDTKAEVMQALDAGQTVRDIAEDFGLSMATVSNWHAEWKRGDRSGMA